MRTELLDEYLESLAGDQDLILEDESSVPAKRSAPEYVDLGEIAEEVPFANERDYLDMQNFLNMRGERNDQQTFWPNKARLPEFVRSCQ